MFLHLVFYQHSSYYVLYQDEIHRCVKREICPLVHQGWRRKNHLALCLKESPLFISTLPNRKSPVNLRMEWTRLKKRENNCSYWLNYCSLCVLGSAQNLRKSSWQISADIADAEMKVSHDTVRRRLIEAFLSSYIANNQYFRIEMLRKVWNGNKKFCVG